MRDISAAGHEIASHGWGHERITELTPDAFRDSVRDSKLALEDLTGLPVLGYRAPSFSIVRGGEWALDILIEEGYRYDSSLFPVRRAGYGLCRWWSLIPIAWIGRAALSRSFPPATLKCGSRAVQLSLQVAVPTFRLFPLVRLRQGGAQVRGGARNASDLLHPPMGVRPGSASGRRAAQDVDSALWRAGADRFENPALAVPLSVSGDRDHPPRGRQARGPPGRRVGVGPAGSEIGNRPVTERLESEERPNASPLRIRRIEAVGEQWDRFVGGAAGSTFCHLAGWSEIMSDVLRHECHYLVAEDGAGVWHGILPLVHVRGILGRYLVSLPFLNDGGPIGSALARRQLVEHALVEAQRSKADVLELRAREPSRRAGHDL